MLGNTCLAAERQGTAQRGFGCLNLVIRYCHCPFLIGRHNHRGVDRVPREPFRTCNMLHNDAGCPEGLVSERRLPVRYA